MLENTTNKVLRWIIIVGIFLIPFIPLIVMPSMFFPFITGKNFIFRIIVEIVFAAWLVLMYRDSLYRPKFSLVFASIGAFIIIIGLADIFGENPTKSIWSNFERMEGFVALLHLGMYALCAGTVFNTQKLWWWFAHTSIGVSVIISTYALSQFIGFVATHQGSRLDATFGNASYLAVYMLFHIFLLAFLLVRHNGHVLARWVYGILIVIETLVLYHTATRGAILGLIGGTLLAAIIIVLFGKEYQRARKVSVGVLVLVILFIGAFFGVKNTGLVKESPVLSRFANISFEETTTQSRFIIWGMAFEGFKEHPVLGWGQENFNLIFNKFYKPILYKQEPWFDRAHNVFLDWLSAGGILGLLLYLSLFAVILFYLWKASLFTLVEKSIFTGLFAGYFFHNLFVFDNIISYLLFFSMLGYFYQVSIYEKEKEKQIENTPPSYLSSSIVSVVVLILLVFGMYFINVRGIFVSKNLLQALAGHKEGLSANISFFKKALAYNYASQEVNEQLLQFASRVASISEVPGEIKQEAAMLAEKEMAKQIEKQPNDARLMLFYGSFLSQIGKHKEGLLMLERARKASPQKQLVGLAFGNIYLNTGEYEKALEHLGRIYELDKTYPRAWEGYIVGAIYANRGDIEEELLKNEISKDYYFSSDQIVNAYAARSRFKDLIFMWEERVRREPSNPQYNLSLASAYAQNRQFAKAIEQIERVIELKQEFKEQGEYFIKELSQGRIPQ